LVGALADSLRRQSATQQRLHLQGCARLVTLLPELAEMGIISQPDWTLPTEQERRLMFDAVARYLSNVSGPAGTLLVLDDLHWAGQDALDLLQVVMRSVPERPLRLLAAYRDTDLAPSDPLALFAADMTREGQTVRAFLAPLAEAEATALLAELLPEAASGDARLRRQVIERVGGIPLFLVYCVQALSTGQLTWNGDTHVPWTLREAILQRIVALPDAAQQVLRLAAVVGRRAQRALLVTVAARSELGEEVSLEALEWCGRARLLVEAGDDAYEFAHDVIREVLLTDLGTARRALLHRRVAEALEQEVGTPPIGALAYHYARSGETEKAISYLEQAGDVARVHYAQAEATEAYSEVIARLEAIGRGVDAARVREKLGEPLTILAHYDEALDTLEKAAARYDLIGDRESQVRTLAQLGRVHRGRGTAQEGLRRLLPLAETLTSTTPSPGTARLYVALTHLYFSVGLYQQQLATAKEAIAMAQSLGDGPLLAVAQERYGSALIALGQLEEARRVLGEEVIPRAKVAKDAQTWSHALINLGAIAIHRGDFLLARNYAEMAIAHAEQVGDRTDLALLTFQHGILSFYLGAWDVARGDFQRGTELAPTDALSVNHLGGLGLWSLATGDEEVAFRYFSEALALAERRHDARALRWITGVLVERDLLAGQAEQALTRLTPLLELVSPDVSNVDNVDAVELRLLLAWVHIELGDLLQAEHALTPLVAELRAAQRLLALSDALRLQGILATRQGRWQEAGRSLEEALGLAREFHLQYEEAKILMWSGELLIRQQEEARAQRRFEEARTILERLGERLYARRIEQALGYEADVERHE
jgi:tetratricopeptide (TPR) repeat protein